MRIVTALLLTATVALTTIAFAQAPAAPAAPPAPLYAALYKTGPKWDAAKPPGEQAFFKRAFGASREAARRGDDRDRRPVC